VGRVLKPGGSLYLNLGDTYRGKSLLGIPWRVAMELTERGWYLRNAIVWYKPYGLPSAIKDRLTNRYEFVFHLTRSRRYFFNLDPIRIPNTSSRRRMTGPVRRGAQGLAHRPGLLVAGNFIPNPKGKNPGTSGRSDRRVGRSSTSFQARQPTSPRSQRSSRVVRSWPRPSQAALS